MTIIIDGTSFNVGIKSISGKSDMLDKTAERTADGVLHREIVGIFDNYEIVFASSYGDPIGYSDLWFKLTEPTPWHTIVLPTFFGAREIEGYFAGTSHEISRQINGITYWKNLSTSFVSRGKRPA